MKIEERLNRERIYAEIIELTPWDFVDNSLLPGPVLLHSTNMMMRHFANYYWNIFNRVEDKKVTYEIPLINMNIFDKNMDFLDERRLLFHTTVHSVFDQSMIQVETRIFKAIYPFEELAVCSWHGVECWHKDENDWILGEFEEVPGIMPELAKLLPEASRSSVENVQTVISKISAGGEWTGPVETTHKMLHSYCEYGYMSAFMNYVGPMVSIGKEAMMKWMRANAKELLPPALTRKLDYKNWRLWVGIKKAFYFNDDVTMISYYMKSDNRHYIRHELYSAKPKILRNIFLEEYTLD